MFKDKLKCFFCKKKKKTLFFKCKCNEYFCLCHLLPEKHTCTFDFKKEGKEKIKLENPKVFNDKIIKI